MRGWHQSGPICMTERPGVVETRPPTSAPFRSTPTLVAHTLTSFFHASRLLACDFACYHLCECGGVGTTQFFSPHPLGRRGYAASFSSPAACTPVATMAHGHTMLPCCHSSTRRGTTLRLLHKPTTARGARYLTPCHAALVTLSHTLPVPPAALASRDQQQWQVPLPGLL